MIRELKCGKYILPIGQRTLIMGILNLTFDSFSGDGLGKDLTKAVKQAEEFYKEGADILDLGGESTRPGAEPVSETEELERVIPVIEKLKKEIDLPISIDTYKPEVAKEALNSGACIINDIYGLRNEAMLKLASLREVPVIIMHIKGTPKNMQENPTYDDVVQETISFFKERIEEAKKYNVKEENIIIDPGIGFGKTLEHNLEIIRRLKEFKILDKPILVGPSRKSFIGKILNLPPEERIEGTAASVALGIAFGVDIIRVHDVQEMFRVAKVSDAIIRR